VRWIFFAYRAGRHQRGLGSAASGRARRADEMPREFDDLYALFNDEIRANPPTIFPAISTPDWETACSSTVRLTTICSRRSTPATYSRALTAPKFEVSKSR